MAVDIRILHGELAPGPAMTLFSAAHPEAGGIVSFVGKVRPDANVEELELKHYAPLTLKGMEELAESVLARWPLEGILLHHRTGRMIPVGTTMPGAPNPIAITATKPKNSAAMAA